MSKKTHARNVANQVTALYLDYLKDYGLDGRPFADLTSDELAQALVANLADNGFKL